jgi:hypothetical protein
LAALGVVFPSWYVSETATVRLPRTSARLLIDAALESFSKAFCNIALFRRSLFYGCFVVPTFQPCSPIKASVLTDGFMKDQAVDESSGTGAGRQALLEAMGEVRYFTDTAQSCTMLTLPWF